VAECAHGSLADSGAFVGGGGGIGREHGVSATAQALRLEYGKLRRLMESASPVVKSRGVKAPAARRSRSIVPPAFVELMPSPTVGLPECVIELQGRRGKMRIHWKGTTAPDLGGLSRALWESK
jgi:hypothetical protein